jgi:hypothetical protein
MWGEDLSVELLRKVFRNLQVWRALYESEGIDTIRNDGVELVIWDIELLLHHSQLVLPDRQAQAILLFLVENRSEEEVAIWMGIDPQNPVGMYATSGLKRLVELIQEGRIEWRRWHGTSEVRGPCSPRIRSNGADHAGPVAESGIQLQVGHPDSSQRGRSSST